MKYRKRTGIARYDCRNLAGPQAACQRNWNWNVSWNVTVKKFDHEVQEPNWNCKIRLRELGGIPGSLSEELERVLGNDVAAAENALECRFLGLYVECGQSHSAQCVGADDIGDG